MSASRGPEIPADEFRERQRRAALLATERDLNGLVVWSVGGNSVQRIGDVLYLANHHTPIQTIADTPHWSSVGHSAIVLPVYGDPVLLTTSPVEESGGLVCVDDARHVAHLPQAVARAMKERGLEGRVGLVGAEALLLKSYRDLTAELGDGVVFEPADDLVEGMRVIKSPAEIEAIRHSVAVGVEWMKVSMEAVAEGRTEGEIVGEGLRFLAANGGFPLDVAIASGARSHLYWGDGRVAHWDISRPLKRGDLLHCDNWGPVNGYYTDFSRSTVVGRAPTEDQRRVLEGAIGVVDAMVDAARVGATYGELHATGVSWLVDHGFGGSDGDGTPFHEMFPAFGHSLGLDVEPPFVIHGESAALERDMVVAIEAVIGLPGIGAAGFEHDILITDGAPEVLDQDCPARWWD